jgi:DNA sulfur modification protein DndD
VLLEEITLHNFGGYRGRQVIPLAPPSTERPVVLFGGLNGAGKSTLLDALQLALYGRRARCAGRANLAYEEYLRRCVHRAVSGREGAALELSFHANVDGEPTRFRIHRSWDTKAKVVKERVNVFRNDAADPLLTDRWDDFVEELIPLDIASLFFFDGEKIEALADPERAARVIETAVDSLLGLNLFDRLSTDLIALERRKQGDIADAGTRDRIDELELTVVSARAERARVLQEQAAQRNVLDRAVAQRQKSEDDFRREGGELFERQAELELRRSNLADRIHHIDQRLIDVTAGQLPLRLVEPLVRQVVEQHQIEKEAQREAILSEVLTDRDGTLLRALETRGSTNEVRWVEEFLARDRERRTAAVDAQQYLHLSDEAQARLAFIWPNELDRAQVDARDLLAQREELRAELDEADRQLAAVPSREALAAASRRREEATRAHAEADTRHDVAVEAVAAADRTLAAHEAELDKAFRSAKATLASQEDADRIVRHATKVRETLAEFRRTLLERHLNRIEAAMLDSLHKLLRKQQLVADLRFDPRTFELSLFDGEGVQLPPERLSAGERQLLAVAMLWGLARVSGRELPTIIDTPLGRLDSTHRKLIVERYFPNASHQVLLLSTDEEIDEELATVLQDSIGRSYELRYDDTDGSSTVHEGYFWQVGNVA